MSDQKDLRCPNCGLEYSVPDVEGTWYCYGEWDRDNIFPHDEAIMVEK